MCLPHTMMLALHLFYIFVHLLPFLTVSLCRTGQDFSHPVLSILCHVFSQLPWYFFMSSCMLSLHILFGRPLLLLQETSSRNNFAQMWLGSRLKQWPNHFRLLFSRQVSTGFMCASLPDVLISDVIQPGLPSCPSQLPHFD